MFHLVVVPGDVKPPSRLETQGRQIQADQQSQSKKSRRTEGQTQMGTNDRINICRGGRFRSDFDFRVDGLGLQIFSGLEPSRNHSRVHGEECKLWSWQLGRRDSRHISSLDFAKIVAYPRLCPKTTKFLPFSMLLVGSIKDLSNGGDHLKIRAKDVYEKLGNRID